MSLPYTKAQWEWCAKKHREGYSVKLISQFLHVHRETVRRHFIRMGELAEYLDELPPLSTYIDEFNRLGEME